MGRTRGVVSKCLLVGLIVAAGWGLAVHASAEEVKLGILMPLSGTNAHLGEEVYRGAEIAKDMINERGGVWGQKVVFAKADAPDTNSAVSEANRLINREKVKLIFGSYASAISYAASEVAERNRVIYWEEGAVANNITERGFKYLFRFIYSAKQQGILAAPLILDSVAPKLGIKLQNLKVAVIHEDSNYGTSLGNSIMANLQSKGVKNVTIEPYNAKAVDLSSLVLKLKSFNPDIIVATSYVPDSILFWRQAKENGLNVKAMIGTGAGHSLRDFPQAMGNEANGVLSIGTSMNLNASGLTPEAKKLYKELFSRFGAKYKTQPSPYAGMGFTAMYVLLNNVLPKAGSFDPDRIREETMKLNMPVGSTVIGWGIKFDQNGDNVNAVPMLSQWRGQQLYTVYPKKFATSDKLTLPLPAWGKRQGIGK